MPTQGQRTFIVDCDTCKAKVAALEAGRADWDGVIDDGGEPFAERLLVGNCPQCGSLLAGHTIQLDFDGFNAYENAWSDIVRVYPKPAKTFLSKRIPRAVSDSLLDGERALQANANIAASAMFGRALEALCRDLLKQNVMLGPGIAELRAKKFIDDRLYDWSEQLHLFRNNAAHPDDSPISREDAEDLQTLAHAIVEYIYDLTDRYNEFKTRKQKARILASDGTPAGSG